MNTAVSYLTQSKYYSPAFNAAIFDGPIRIYFAQYQEAQALKIYFRLQEKLKEAYLTARELHRKSGKNVFVMLYPNEDTFDSSFDSARPGEKVRVEPLGEDFVLGVKGQLNEGEYDLLYIQLSVLMEKFIDRAQSVIEEVAL